MRPEREADSVGSYRPARSEPGEDAARHASNLENWQ
jgi:hypothetical protein